MDISELYYQQMINGNYTSNMLNGLSGNSSNTGENSIASILGMMSGTSGVSGSDILSGGSSLYGASGVSGADFASVLERYLSTSSVSSEEASGWVETLDRVLDEVQESGDHTKSTATVQELYNFFQEKMKSESKGIQSLSDSSSAGTGEDSQSSDTMQNMMGQVINVESGVPDIETIEAQIEQTLAASIVL